MRAVFKIARAGLHRHVEGFTYAATAVLALAAWTIFASFAIEQWGDVQHDTEVEVVHAQGILRSHIDTVFESAETLLKVADTWLEESSQRPIRPPLSVLGDHLGELTESDARAVVLVTADERGAALPLSAVPIQQPQPAGATPDDLTIDPTQHKHMISIGQQRFDGFAGGEALPLTMRVGPNAYGIKFLCALLPIRVGEGPFGLLMPSMPARIGVARLDGEILLSWPREGSRIGMIAPVLSRRGGDAGRVSYTKVEDFPDIGRAYVSSAKVDSAPLVAFAVLSSDYLSAEIWRRVRIPGLITLFGSSLIIVGGILIGRAVRRNRIEVENTKRALNAAETANEAKRQFLANMSHELRTPLNAINGFAEIMHGQLFGPLGNPQYVSYAGDILGSGKHLLGLIETILDMARFEGGNLLLGDGPTSLRKTVRDTVRLLHARAVDKRLEFHVEVADEPLVRMEPLHLRQIVINLLTNAIKFSKTGGVIAIDTSADPDGNLLLRVTDTGIGIPAEAIDKLFVPFSQVDNAYSRKHEGVGLGLAICRSIMKAYGGAIDLQSTVGMGTMVTLQIPKSRMVAATEIPPRPQAA